MSEPASNPILLPGEFLARFEAAAIQAGFRIEPFGDVHGCRLVAATRRTPGARPRIYVSSGIHGDEPAGPLALLEVLERGVFDSRAVWFLCPLLNPAGFLRLTRENADGLDLNRDYRALKSAEIRAHARWLKYQPNFDLAICVHEDWESNGYYLYELNPSRRPTLSNAIIRAVSEYCPIDLATVIDGRPIAEPGIIRPVDDPLLRDSWPEAIYLRAHHTTLSYTLETPSSFPLPKRVNAHACALQAAIGGLCGPRTVAPVT